MNRLCFSSVTFTLLLMLPLTAVPSHSESYVVFTEPLAPVHYEEDGTIVGIATEIVEEMFKLAGYQPEIRMYPWKRAYYLVQKQKNQFIYTLNRTEKREQLFKWIGPILPKRTYLYKMRDRDDINLTRLEDAKSYMTAVILGHSLTTDLEEKGFKEGKNIVKVPNKTIQTKLFINKRSDLITGNEYTIFRALQSVNLTMKDVKPALFISESSYYLGAHPETDPTIINRLQRASETLYETGFAAAIIDKYMNR